MVLAAAWAATAGVGVREVMVANGLTQEHWAVPLIRTPGRSVGVRAESEGWAPCPLIVVVEWSRVPYGTPGGLPREPILGGGGCREVHVWVFGYQQRLWRTVLWIP